MALPPIDNDGLAKVMERVRAAAAANSKPLAISNSAELEKFFGLRSRNPDKSGDFVDAGDAVHRFEPQAGRLYVTWRLTDVKPVARATFSKRIRASAAPRGTRQPAGHFGQRGDSPTDFREVLTKTDRRVPASTAATADSPIMAEGGTTTLLRAVGGVLVEGSYLRVADAHAAHEPREGQLAAGATDGCVGPTTACAEGHARRVRQADRQRFRGVPVSVRMAVVLRPVDAAKPGCTCRR